MPHTVKQHVFYLYYLWSLFFICWISNKLINKMIFSLRSSIGSASRWRSVPRSQDVPYPWKPFGKNNLDCLYPLNAINFIILMRISLYQPARPGKRPCRHQAVGRCLLVPPAWPRDHLSLSNNIVDCRSTTVYLTVNFLYFLCLAFFI